MIRMQISVISLMILPSPWLCGGGVVNMSSGTREFGKCVKTQLQLVCSNYGSGEFVTTSLLIKRDFLIWINVIYKGKVAKFPTPFAPARSRLRARLTDSGSPSASRAQAAAGPGAAWAALTRCPGSSFLLGAAIADGASTSFTKRVIGPMSGF